MNSDTSQEEARRQAISSAVPDRGAASGGPGGGSIGTAVFSALGVTETTNYLQVHAVTAAQTATIAAGTIASCHLVFWIAAAVFPASALLTAVLFRSGPLPVDADAGRRRALIPVSA